MSQRESHLPSEALLYAALFFAPLAFGATESWSRAIIFLLVAALAVFQILDFGPRGTLPFRIAPLFWAILALIALALIQSLNPISPLNIALADGPFTSSRHETLEWVFDWGIYASVLLMLPRVFHRTASAERLAWVLVVCGALIAIIGIAQQQAGNGSYYGIRKVGYYRVPFGPFPNKNHAGAFLAICGLVGVGLGATVVGRRALLRSAGKQDEFLGQLTVILSLEFLIIVGLLKTNSRGGTVAFLASGLLCSAFYFHKHGMRLRHRAIYWIPLCAAIFIAIARFSGVHFNSYIPSSNENSVTFRHAMISDGLEIVAEFPLFGLGLGALGVSYPLWIDPVMKGYYTDHLHCDPLELATEAGLPLTLSFYVALIATLARAMGVSSKFKFEASPLTLSFAAATISILAHQLLEFPSHIMSVQLAGMVCLAAALGQGDLAHLSSSFQAPLPRTPHATLLIALISLTALFLCIPRIGAAYFDLLAVRYPQPSRHYYQIKALRLEPSVQRHLALARADWQLAIDNPPARTILLRAALRESFAALQAEPLNRNARAVHSGLLFNLDRQSDSRQSFDPR